MSEGHVSVFGIYRLPDPHIENRIRIAERQQNGQEACYRVNKGKKIRERFQRGRQEAAL
jgi:hypothetical protein